MPDTPILRVETLDDLKRILFIQRKVTRRAHDELEAIADDNVLGAIPDPAQIKKFMAEEIELLRSYAMRPTLTEWAQSGGLSEGCHEGATTWGATFGVAIIVGSLVIEQVRQMHPTLGAGIRNIFLTLLSAESQALATEGDSEGYNLMMHFSIANPDGTPIDDPAAKESARLTLEAVVHTLVATCIEYGILTERENGGHVITEMGRRVLFHMLDVNKFIAIMGEAHKKFQAEVPVLANTLATETETVRRRRRPAPKAAPPEQSAS